MMLLMGLLSCHIQRDKIILHVIFPLAGDIPYGLAEKPETV
jgi:hypothetical protein